MVLCLIEDPAVHCSSADDIILAICLVTNLSLVTHLFYNVFWPMLLEKSRGTNKDLYLWCGLSCFKDQELGKSLQAKSVRLIHITINYCLL